MRTMKLIEEELGYRTGEAAVVIDSSIGNEYRRSATWRDGDTTVKVTVVAFVSGIRSRKLPDGSLELMDLLAKYDVLNKGEYRQPVERAVFLWERDGVDGHEEAIDINNNIGLYYQATVEESEAQCRYYIEHLDFSQFDPEAW